MEQVNTFAMIWPFLLLFFIFLPILGFSIYLAVLFIKLARRGIAALDIYLAEKGRKS